jgi:hypothetical protein
MSFNGSGVFSRLYSWQNDKAGGIKIRADRMDAEMNGFATGLTTCITRDGQSTPTANIPMGSYKITGLGTPTTGTDAATKAYADGLVVKIADYGTVGYKSVSGGSTATVVSSVNVAATNAYVQYDGDPAQYTSVLSFSAKNLSSEIIRCALIGAQMTDRTAGAEKGIYTIYTKPSSGAAEERLRVTDTGAVCVGRTSTLSVFKMAVDNTVNAYLATGGNGTCFRGDTTADGAYFGQWIGNGAEIGSIRNVSNTTTLYVTTSDKRLKTNVQPLQDVGGIIDAIKAVKYDWKHVKGATGVGFLAQDLAQAIPEAVCTGDDNETLTPQDDGFKTWGVDLAKIVPYLVAELQQLRQRVATLEQTELG